MNHQSLRTAKPPVDFALSESLPMSRPARPAGPISRFLRSIRKSWLWLTGPRPERFGTSTAAQETLRRSRLISATLVLAVIVIALLIPSALKIPDLWQPILILGALGLLAALLNRSGHVTTSGLIVIIMADLSISQNIIRQPYGLTNTTMADMYLLVIPILIAGMVLPSRFIPLTGAIQVLISIAIFYGLKHDDLLKQEIAKVDGGQAYTAVLGPILLYICGTGIVWLYAWSVDHAILRASRAEELAEARARISEQARQLADQKQRLEAGISALQAVQARVANGEYSVRASLYDNELLPLAVSFNIMAERLGRVEKIEQEHRRLEKAVEQLLDGCNAIARGVAPAAMRATGTLVDRAFPFLTRAYRCASEMIQGSALLDDLRVVLLRQHDYLAQIEANLIASLSLAKDLAIEVVHPLRQTPGDISSSPLGTKTPPASSISEAKSTPGSGQAETRNSGGLGSTSRSESQAAINARINALLDQQIRLLEQTNKYCSQASDLGTRCMQGARMLSQRFKEAA